MPKRRERHQRGLRGPLASPNRFTGAAVPVRRSPTSSEFFMDAVSDALGRLTDASPQALDGVQVGVEEVPLVPSDGPGDRVPLAAAIEASEGRPAQIVIYRRPLEHRAATRKGLRILVYRTLVEQVSALTGLGVDQLDPKGYGEDDDWE